MLKLGLLGLVASQDSPEEKMAKRLLQNLTCNNFKINFKVWKRQLYKSVAMPKTKGGSGDRGNVFRIGIGDNCDRILAKNGDDGYSYTGEMDWFWAPDNVDNANDWKTDNEFAVPDAADKEKANERGRSYGKGFGLEKCGSTLVQDEFGIVYELHVKGRRSKQSPPEYIPRTIIFSCFYPLAKTDYEDLPLDLKKYIDKEYVIGGASIQIRNWGNLTADFELKSGIETITTSAVTDIDYADEEPTDVGTALEQRYASTGGAIAATLLAKSMPTDTANSVIDDVTNPELNLVKKHPERFDYFYRDCWWSAKNMSDDTELAQVQLVNRNCKNSEFHIQLLSDVALPESGHVMVFEAISLGYPLNNYLSDGTAYKIEHTLTCDVDICLKTRTGNHAWPSCHQPCFGERFIDRRTEEQGIFELSTTEIAVTATNEPDTTTFKSTTEPAVHDWTTTFLAETTVSEPYDDLMAAKDFCIDNFFNGHFYQSIVLDEPTFQVCQYIRSKFPEDFEEKLY